MAFAPCICCKVPFGFNPLTVPSSSAITGQREPLCQLCMGFINAKREASGLSPFPIARDAYQPVEAAAL
jgi:hypothetical protein